MDLYQSLCQPSVDFPGNFLAIYMAIPGSSRPPTAVCGGPRGGHRLAGSTYWRFSWQFPRQFQAAWRSRSRIVLACAGGASVTAVTADLVELAQQGRKRRMRRSPRQ
jgi:hypothetical protein